MSSTDFYRAFEERYRGSRELIGKRLEVYLPFIAPLRQLYQPALAIDLGCGRGEWLELLRREGFEPSGIDLDEGMLQACRERELPALQGDAIAHLKGLADESQCVVSGFHIAEHIAFADLETLVVQSLRVLKPGGLLILETPNPENIVVGACNFFLDPTHMRPIPPPLLSFLPEHHGYQRIKVLRLQEAAELAGRSDITLFDVFAGVSPDYSVVAQKAASKEIFERFDPAFAARHGIELHELANRHDATTGRRLTAFNQRLATAEAHAAGLTDALARIGVLQDRLIEATAEAARWAAKIEQMEKQTESSERQREADSRQLRQQIQELHADRNALRASWSWRVTEPLRWGGNLFRRDGAPSPEKGNRLTNAVQRPVVSAMRIVLDNPSLSYRINQRLLRYPSLHQRLMKIAKNGGIMPGMPSYVSAEPGGAFDRFGPASRNQPRQIDSDASTARSPIDAAQLDPNPSATDSAIGLRVRAALRASVDPEFSKGEHEL